MLKDIRRNPLMLTDCYNLSHERLKINTDWEVSHMYNRKSSMILFGFEEIATDLLSQRIEQWMIDEADDNAKRLGLIFPKEMFERVIEQCDGNIPLKVELLKEGIYCPVGTPFAQIRNTVEGFGELVTWWEGIFIMAYFPSTCATESFNMREYLESKQYEYGFDDSFLWRFHSFGFRGHKSLEDAYFAGTAWNLFLQGTDDFHVAQHMPIGVMGSISALAHKVTQQFDDEYECFTHAIKQTAESGEKVVALVIDTYDAWSVINNDIIGLSKYAEKLGVNLVFRPDSGNILEQALAIYKLKEQNGLENISVIIGESISFEVAREYDRWFESNGVPLNFINYGVGAGFYKKIERDTLGWAMKTAFSNGEPRMKLVKSNPFKQSIPNMVHLRYNKFGEMVIHDGDGKGLYDVIYDYQITGEDESTKYVKKVTGVHFDKVRKKALSHSIDNLMQEKILLSKETQERIKEFTDKHN